MQNKLRKIENFFRNVRPPYKWEWIVLGILILIPFVSCFYGDTMSILIYENHFFGAIMEGDGVLSYYEYVMNNLGTGNYATYDFPMYIVLGIWGAPLWFFMGAKGLSPLSSFIAKIYGKSVFLVAFAITVCLVYLICKEVKVSKEHALWGAFIYASSVMIYVSICLNGQTDILGLVFILAGILSYVRGRKLWFVIFYAIAVPFKMYALFTFVPLLLLQEKKIWKIGVQTLWAASIRIICNRLFDPSSPAIQEKNRFESEMFNRLTAQRLPLLNGSVPVVILLLGVICVFCYLKEIKSKEELDKYSVFIPLLTMGCLFVSFESSSYWYLHLTPFLAIMLAYNWGNMKICMLFETVAMLCLTMANYATRAWAFEIYFYPGMALDKLFGDYSALENPIMLDDFCGRIGLVKYAGCIYAAYVVLLFTVIFISRPSKMKREGENIPIRGYAALRLAANAFVAYIPAILYLYNVYLAHKS